jgi:hypothetical protein
MEGARHRARSRRQLTAEAEAAFDGFLGRATPVLKHLTSALRAEGQAFTLFTPEHALRLASDRSRADFIELSLDTTGEAPAVMARISFARGSHTRDEERVVKPGVPVDQISEEDVLEFFLDALEPWLEK